MFSIVIPLWNKAATVESTIATVLAQTFADFEVIVIDDGSTDGGAALVAEIRDSRVRLLRQENAGGGAARNAGIVASKCHWVAFIDADDLWLPDHLAELDHIRRNHREAALIGTAYWVGHKGDPIPRGRTESTVGLIDYFQCVGRGEDPLWVSSAALRKDAWKSLGGFTDRATSADSEMWARVALEYPVAVSRRKTAIYVLGTGGVIDSSKRRFVGSPPQTLAQLSRTPALIADRIRTTECPDTRLSFEMFIDRYVGWTLMSSVAAGDVSSIRALRSLYRLKQPPLHRLLIAIASLPGPIARTLYQLGLQLKALARYIRGVR